jgi:hypothetical protein
MSPGLPYAARVLRSLVASGAPRPRSRGRAWWAALALGFAAAGCAVGDGMQDKLYDSTREYNRAMRWGDADDAAAHLPVVSRDRFLEIHEEHREELDVVDYNVVRLQLDKGRGVARARAELQWHTDERLILETTTIDQVWQWHEGQWVLVDEYRSSGTPLAIFAEPDEKPHPYLPGLEAYRKAAEIGEENDPKAAKRAARKAKRGRGTPPPPPEPAESDLASRAAAPTEVIDGEPGFATRDELAGDDAGH